ncbi:MAG: RNase adapter RapZ [Clostridiales bacterium]|nr:RNase adapter RapZ [Clostridiales bacterium]
MELIIVTGLSGAGKTQAINCLEDLGYYCIDNMPPALIKNFIELTSRGKTAVEKAALVVDVRGGEFFSDAKESLMDLRKLEIEYKIIFLEADEKVLIRRYNETRRTHPLSERGSAEDGIRKEVELLSEIRKMADYVIDTSNMKSSRLMAEVRSIIDTEKNGETFTLNIKSFGYKYGIPLDADFVFDMRFIPNPFYVPTLKPLSGNNKKVQEFVMKHEESQAFLDTVSTMIKAMIPCYVREGKYHLNIAFGCTGGHHRSVTMANIFAEKLKAEGMRITLEHRDL